MLDSPLITYLLAQAFGLYFVVLSIVFLSRENYYRRVLQEQPRPSFLSCSLSLLMSIFLILIHNRWVLNPRIFITLICWGFFIRTVLLLAYPEYIATWTHKFCADKKRYYMGLIFMGIMGVLLSIRGTVLFIAAKS